MSDDAETSRRDYRHPHSSKHPIPTIQGYKDEKEKEKEELGTGNGTASKQRPSEGRGQDEYKEQLAQHPPDSQETKEGRLDQSDLKDTSQVNLGAGDPKTRRKQMKHRKADGTEREVTDPVTHLPVVIHDFTDADLKGQEEDETGGGHGGAAHKEFDVKRTHPTSDSRSDFQQPTQDPLSSREWQEHIFPPPSFQGARADLQKIYGRGMLFTASLIIPICAVTFWMSFSILHGGSGYNWFGVRSISALVLCGLAVAACAVVALGMQQWTEKQLKDVWEDEVWAAQRKQAQRRLHSEEPESTMWFNQLIGSIWPVVNPDLFASLADTLEVSEINSLKNNGGGVCHLS